MQELGPYMYAEKKLEYYTNHIKAHYFGDISGGLLNAEHQANWPVVRIMVLPAWFGYLDEHFSSKESQFSKFCLAVKTKKLKYTAFLLEAFS